MNKKSLIYNAILAVLSVVIIVLVAFVKDLMGGEWTVIHYTLLMFEDAGGLTLLFGILLLAFELGSVAVLVLSVLSILTACNILKGEALAKLFRKINALVTKITLIASVIPFLYFAIYGEYYTILILIVIAAVMMVVSKMDYKPYKTENK